MISILKSFVFKAKVRLVTICVANASYAVMSLLVVSSECAPALVPTGNPAGRLTALTVQPRAGESIPDLCRRLARGLQEVGATPLQLLAFGDCRAQAAVVEALSRQLDGREFPVTWVEGRACSGAPVAGLQVHAFSGPVESVAWDGRPIASVFTDGGARQCVIGGVVPPDLSAARPAQTTRALEQLQSVLNAAGFQLEDVVRTWFFLDKILTWYDEFNQARSRIYSGVKFRTGSLPASTGIGAGNPARAALTLAAWAFRPVEKNSYAEEVASPLQCPAPAYGSSFSRALEISTNGGRQLFISGTASIAPGGKTAWVGDLRRQVDLTMQVVEAMLRERGFSLSDLTRATAYFRRAAEAPIFAEWLAARQLSQLPIVTTECEVCRDDLLFELEAEAASGTRRKGKA